jgi:hypothetical protein
MNEKGYVLLGVVACIGMKFMPEFIKIYSGGVGEGVCTYTRQHGDLISLFFP